jgi:hypothetical protein
VRRTGRERARCAATPTPSWAGTDLRREGRTSARASNRPESVASVTHWLGILAPLASSRVGYRQLVVDERRLRRRAKPARGSSTGRRRRARVRRAGAAKSWPGPNRPKPSRARPSPRTGPASKVRASCWRLRSSEEGFGRQRRASRTSQPERRGGRTAGRGRARHLLEGSRVDA